MSVFDELITITPKLQATLAEKDDILKKQLSEMFSPLQRFIETRDKSILIKEFEKENIQPTDVTSQKRTRQRKQTVLDEISENSIQIENIKVKQEKLSIVSSESTCSAASGTFLKGTAKKTRQRNPSPSENSDTHDGIGNATVKVEKISSVVESEPDSTVTSGATVTDVDIVIKTEEMPAPRRLPPRKKKIKSEAQENSVRSTRASQRRKESDVIIQNTTILKIDITDDSDTPSERESQVLPEKSAPTSSRATRSKMRQKKPTEEPQSDSEKIENSEPEIKKVRSTRTKTIRQNKRNRSQSSGEESEASKEQKKSRSSTSSETDENKSAQTVYEDAVSTVDEAPQSKADATFVAQKVAPQSPPPPPPPLDRTVVVEKPRTELVVEKKVGARTKEVKTPPCPKSKKPTKEMFSPYDKTPLRKKVEAFEKLEAAALQEKGPHSTKTKLRSDTAGQPKSKLLTPLTAKFIPKSCSTNKTSKLLPSSKLDRSSSNESTFSVKSLSALKSSQAEFREREKRRVEKEQEALKKREAILLAQMEEKKKKREEKQWKREILEKDKQKQLEQQQRRDEEKFKQVIAEKEEKLQKQKEEAEKKRLIAKKKALVIKQQEEREARMATEKEAKVAASQVAKLGAERVDSARAIRTRPQQTDRKALPQYMINKPPLLPTDDCYDSDSSEYGADYNVPDWAKEGALMDSLRLQNAVPENLKNTFFCRQTHTPDLREIFELIDPRKLKRTSSAVWKKPPRYTQFSVTSIVQFSDDEDIDV